MRRNLCVEMAIWLYKSLVFRFVLWRKCVRLRRLRWSIAAVSNHDFTNFTKHSTVLTSILQQISILYQHFQSAETAIPALEQAKTMLKIALPTFKNDENHTQYGKIHVQNSGCVVYFQWIRWRFSVFWLPMWRLVVRKWRNGVALQRVDAGLLHFGFKKWRKRMRLLRLRGAMRRLPRWNRQNHIVFSVNSVAVFCILVANVAVGCAEMAVRWCGKGGWWCGCVVFVFGFFMISERMGRLEICKFQFL